MFISQVSEDVSGARGGRARGVRSAVSDRDGIEYSTATELFELMARSSNYATTEGAPLSAARDLVFLYKNLDIGTKLLSESKEFKSKSPNQRVETIVYEDFDSDSDLSEICSEEDICNMILINKERMDRFNSCLDHNLCPKFGNIEINNMSMKLENMERNIIKRYEPPASSFHDKTLAVSMADYIRSDCMQYNQNVSMDNIIRYVNYTIDQLKRISNGDYLTDKAREKWKETERQTFNTEKRDSKQALVKPAGRANPPPAHTTRAIRKWDAIIRSEVNIQTISQILEKKLVVEVSKPLRESLKYLTIYRPKSLLITCKPKQGKELEKDKKSKESINLKLELKKPVTAFVVDSIAAIGISQQPDDVNNVLPLPSKQTTDAVFDDPTEVSVVVKELRSSTCEGFVDIVSEGQIEERVTIVVENLHVEDDEPITDNHFTPTDISDVRESILYTEIKDPKSYGDSSNEGCNPESSLYPAAADMRAIIQRLQNMQSPLTEEINEDRRFSMSPILDESIEESSPTSPRSRSGKKRSPTRVRVKSPYENKSRVLDEKKRKRLLEIRQKREKTKQALKDIKTNNKDRQFPRVNSITKLSITNKSFYDSIYGQPQNASAEGDQKNKKDFEELTDIKKYDKDNEEIAEISAATKPQRYTNRNYFLDEADTEMMYLEMNRKSDSLTNSEISSRGIRGALHEIAKFINVEDGAATPTPRSMAEYDDFAKDEIQTPKITFCESSRQESEIKTPKKTDNKAQCTEDDKKEHPSVEFRKSIDKIYDLINKKCKNEVTETRYKSKFTALAERTPVYSIEETSVHCTDSGTSLKHCISSSNPSYYSFEKGNDKNCDLKVKIKSKYRNTNNKVLAVVPKVIIGTKLQTQKTEQRMRSPRTSLKSTAPNPLKAISQLLHEFDDVQKSRKSFTEKQVKKEVTYAEGKGAHPKKIVSPDSSKVSPGSGAGVSAGGSTGAGGGGAGAGGGARRWARSPAEVPARPAGKVTRKKVTDMFDEIREARGEAVRGPSFRLNDRLNSLAQPKKTYVQAQIEDFQTRYGKSILTHRLQRLNASASSEPPPRPIPLPATDKPRSPKKRRSPRSPRSPPSSKAPPSASPVPEKPKAPNDPTRPITFTVNLQKLTMNNVSDTIREPPKKPTYTATTGSSSNNAEKVSRIPIVPVDIEIDSLTSSSKADDSSAIGNKIHQMVDTVVTRPFVKPLSTALCGTTSQSQSQNSTDLNSSQEKDALEHRAKNLSCSLVSSFGGDVTPVVSDIPFRCPLQTVTEVDSPKELSEKEKESSTDNSMAELENIEKALYSRIASTNSSSSDPKRLRRKNLTLKPKDTVIPLMLLTDTETHNHNSISEVTKKDATKKVMNELCALPWQINQIPVQIATVGYVFPQYSRSAQHFSSELKINRSKTDHAMQYIKNIDAERMPVPPYAIDLFNKLLHISSLLHEEKEHVLENIEEEEDKNIEYYCEKTLQVSNAQNIPVHNEVAPTTAKTNDNSSILPLTNTNDQSVRTNDQVSALANNKIYTSFNEQVSTLADEQIEQLPALVDEKASTPNDDLITDSADKQVSQQLATTDNKTEPINACKIDSLDILVGLLSEIQKITSTQTQMTLPGAEDIETVLKNAQSFDNFQKEVHNIISITSLENLRQLESDGSLYSFCLSDNISTDNDDCTEKLINSHFIDNNFVSSAIAIKEVKAQADAQLQVKERVHKCTDVPSRLLPQVRNHGTNVTNSLIGVLSDTSTDSALECNDIYLKRRSSFTCMRNVIRFPKSLQLTNPSRNFKKKDKEIALGTSPVQLNSQVEPQHNTVIKEHSKINDFSGNDKLITLKEIKLNAKVKPKGSGSIPFNKKVAIKTGTVVTKNNKLYYTDLDPIMNFKRDVLVTMYSVLVFTVFAALSIPDILYKL